VVAVTHAVGGPESALRRGYWMQLWAALYALGRVYPQPRLTAFVAVLVVVLAALIVDTAPVPVGWSR
jgi:hypothetical protein